MTTAAEWFAGARPRTLGAALSPVLVGTAAAYADADTVIWWRAVAALVVARGRAGVGGGAGAGALPACACCLASTSGDRAPDRATGKRAGRGLAGARAAGGFWVGFWAGAFWPVAAGGVLSPPALIALAAL